MLSFCKWLEYFYLVDLSYYDPPMAETTPKKSSNKVIYLILGCIGLVVVLSCCVGAIIVGVSAFGIGRAKEKVDELAVNAFFNSIESELESVYDEKMSYPANLEDLDLDSLTSLDYELSGSYIYIGSYTITYTQINNGKNYRLVLENPNGSTFEIESSN